MGEHRWRHGGGRQRNQRGCCRVDNRYRIRFRNRRRSGESICHNILDPRHVHYRTVELSQVSKVVLLKRGPGQRNPEQDKS